MWLYISLIILCGVVAVQYTLTTNSYDNSGRVRFVKGIPDFDKGSVVTINFCSDQIIVNDNYIIPLERVKRATSFKVRQVTLEGKDIKDKKDLRRRLFKLWGAKKNLNFLSVEFINNQGHECNGLFVSDSYPYIKEFADTVNKKIGFPVKGQIIT